jgi:drug/metabolite transporter (DMT)-like permease
VWVLKLPKYSLSSASSSRTIGTVCLLVTALGWALNWPAIKFVLQVWPPLFSRGLAGLIASMALALIAGLSGESLVVPRTVMPRLLFAAFTNVFAWMGFSTIAMKWVSVGEGALLVYTMPIWVTVIAWLAQGQRPTKRGFCALFLGFAGVAVLLSAQGLTFDEHRLAGIGLTLGAAVLFAFGSVVNRGPLPIAPVALTALQVGLGCLPMLIIGLAFEHPQFEALTPTASWAMVYMTVFPMAVCYLTWFAAVRMLPPAVASTGMLLVPLLGTLSASVMLGEPLGFREIVAMALTFAGVTLALTKT